MVEQLNKLSVCISLLALLMNSKPHRKALMKVLSDVYVAHNISVKKVDRFVGNIAANNMIAVFDDEIPSEGHGNMKALYITISCKRYTLPRALLDNGSFMKMIPMATLSRLPVDPSHMRKTYLVVCAFSGMRKESSKTLNYPFKSAHARLTLTSKSNVLWPKPSPRLNLFFASLNAYDRPILPHVIAQINPMHF